MSAIDPASLTCQEAIAILGDYLESTLGPAEARGLDGHLAECDECQAYLRTYRTTREAAARVGRVAMPDEMKARLRGFLRDHLRRPEP